MLGTCTGSRFSLREREEEAVKVVEPASMKERVAEELQATPVPFPRSRRWSGALQPIASLPPETEVKRVASSPVSSKTENRPAPAVVSKIRKIVWLSAWLRCRMKASALAVPFLRVSLDEADAVPTPTLPLALMSIELVGAPGRMRKGRREPPVTSRTKKLASLPAMSQVWAVKPPELFCSRRMAGVLLVETCRSSTGVEVRKPTRPVESTKIELVDALPVIVNGTVEAVMSSIENLLAPPEAESLAVSCQSWLGKPVPVEVSSNLMRVL